MYRARRRRLLLGVFVVLLLAHAVDPLLNDMGHVRMPTARTHIDPRRPYRSALSWPQQSDPAAGGCLAFFTQLTAQAKTLAALRSRCDPLRVPTWHSTAVDATTTPRRTHE